MAIIDKMVAGTAIVAAILLLVSMAQAGAPAKIWDIDIIDRGETLYGEVSLKNQGGENVTALLNVKVDSIPVCSSFMHMTVETFKGFPISRVVRTDFEVSNEVGTHEMEVLILVKGEILRNTYEYTVYEEEEQIEEMEKGDDSRQCP